MNKNCFIAACFAGCLVAGSASGAVLVRMEIQQGSAAAESVDLKLYDDIAPRTVTNFFAYINSGRYTNSFLHRSVPDFIVQGGGYTFDPSAGAFTYDADNDVYPGGLQEVPIDAAIKNEFRKRNLIGTIAMAKLPGDPDSATSQWYVNLKDNSSLDTAEGGFTVFGEILGNGMDVFNAIAARPTANITDIHYAFGALTLIDYIVDPMPVPSPVPVQANLVRQTAIAELLSITSDIDFRVQTPGIVLSADITITNTGGTDLSIGNIADTDALSMPFSILAGSDNCSNSALSVSGSCKLTVQFSPDSKAEFEDTFNIEFPGLSLSYSFPLTGDVGDSEITPSYSVLDFGEQPIHNPATGFPKQIVLFLSNDGSADLNISSITLDGINADEFTFVDNCTLGGSIAPEAYCVLPVNFLSSTLGDKSATLTIISDDVDESTLVIPITGSTSVDVDGVSVEIEDAAPNSGDGNNDDVLDSIQSNVVSMPGRNGEYITLVTTPGYNLRAATVLDDSQMQTVPSNIEFGIGVMGFEIDNVPPRSIEMGIILPEGMVPTSYHKYGPTPDDINPHWYEFLYDGITGAQILGNVSITSPNGTVVRRSIIKLWFKDGERGDADLTENGVIVDPGGPVVSATSRVFQVDSGSLGVAGIMLFLLALIFRPGYGRAIHGSGSGSV